MINLLKDKYIACEIENNLYENWEEKKYFTPELDNNKPYYSIILPPPNVTGILHIGHVLNTSITDSIIRYKRMKGFNTLWLPGTDHAGIATQNKVERMLLEQGTTKEEIGKKAFIAKTWEWKINMVISLQNN